MSLGGVVVSALGSQVRDPKLNVDKNMFVFLNAVTPAHLLLNRYRSKQSVCDLAILAGAKGLESYLPVCVFEIQ